MPPLYKLFIETFKLGDGTILCKKYLNPVKNTVVPCVSIVFLPFKEGRELIFNGFFSNEELLNDWQNYTSTSREWTKDGFLRIADRVRE